MQKKLKRASIWMAITGLIVLGLYVSVLAFPQIILHNKVRQGAVVLYYNGENHAEMERLARSTDMRLKGGPLYDSTRYARAFYFQNEKWFAFYARLSFLTMEPQGFNLSIFGNSYIDGPRVERLGKFSGGKPRLSVFEGEVSHIAAHEIAHQYIIERFGRGTWQNLPHWKREGLPEYLANFGVRANDSLLGFEQRVDILNDPNQWNEVRGWDRIHYEAGLLVEYLVEIKGMTLDEVVDREIQKAEIRDEMNTLTRGQ